MKFFSFVYRASLLALTLLPGLLSAIQSVPLLNAGHKAYIAMPREERIAYFADAAKRKEMAGAGYYPLCVKLEIGDAKSVILTETDNPSFKTASRKAGEVQFQVPAYVLCRLKKGAFTVGNLKIGCAYTWKTDTGKTGNFVTEATAPRMLKIKGVPNVRDLGGRTGLNGRRVKQGLVYRTAGLNDNASAKVVNDAEGKKHTVYKPGKNRLDEATKKYIVQDLGVKTDIDLRNTKERYGMTGSPAGPEVKWLAISSASYGRMQQEFGRRQFTKVFRVFLDERNYPVIFHCIAGQDRTGAVAFILNGLLGVSEEELYLDWEVTGFWNKNTKFNHQNRFNHLVSGFQKYPGKTINEKIEQYVLSLGFTPADIAAFRQLMLEEKPAAK